MRIHKTTSGTFLNVERMPRVNVASEFNHRYQLCFGQKWTLKVRENTDNRADGKQYKPLIATEELHWSLPDSLIAKQTNSPLSSTQQLGISRAATEPSKDIMFLSLETISEPSFNHVMRISGLPCTLQDSFRGWPVCSTLEGSSFITNEGASAINGHIYSKRETRKGRKEFFRRVQPHLLQKGLQCSPPSQHRWKLDRYIFQSHWV